MTVKHSLASITEPTSKPTRSTPMRKTCTLLVILGAGLVAGALLGEASMVSFSLIMPSALGGHCSGIAGNVNGYLNSAGSRGQSRHPFSPHHATNTHHLGL